MARILVSDDDLQILRIVSMILEQGGHDVVATGNSDEVLGLATTARFDAIILDVMMPVSGYELLNQLRRHEWTAQVPILFLSGRTAGEDRVRGLREGADDYLTKPFEAEELLLRVERLISWRLRGERLDDESDHHLGRYEVREVIGEGTMGTVYRGWDPRLERAVALKTIRLDQAVMESKRQELLERLRHEAVTVAQFNHPNIVAVYDMGNARDSAYIAMELVEGISLRRYLKAAGPPRTEQLIPLVAGMSRGLAVAHSRDVIHRDVKPNNVLLGRDGGIKMSDFGVAALRSRSADDAGRLYGTPGYVPPEALRQEPYTAAGDLYGLGATLYETMTGSNPVVGSNLRQTIKRTLDGDIAPLREKRGDIPAEIADLVMDLLSQDPVERPPAAAVATALEKAAAAGHLLWQADDLPADA